MYIFIFFISSEHMTINMLIIPFLCQSFLFIHIANTFISFQIFNKYLLSSNYVRYINRQEGHYVTYKVNCFHKYTCYGELQQLIPLDAVDPSPPQVG